MSRTYCCLVGLLLLSPMLRAQDMPLSDILIPGEGWKKIEGTFTPISALSADRMDTNAIVVLDAKDKPQALLDEHGASIKKDVPIIPDGPRSAFAKPFAYLIYKNPRLLIIASEPSPGSFQKVATMKLTLEASVLCVSPDKGSLLIGDAADKYIWIYRIGKDGMLSAGEKYIAMRVLPYVSPTLKDKPKTEPRSDISAICFDSAGRIYAATNIGVQVFDPTGRLCGVLTNPSKERLTAMCFGGSKGDRLFIACGTEIYSRPLKATWAFAKDKDKDKK